MLLNPIMAVVAASLAIWSAASRNRATVAAVPLRSDAVPLRSAHQVAMRVARDGRAYTYQEFMEHYGASAAQQWRDAREATSVAPVGQAALQQENDELRRQLQAR